MSDTLKIYMAQMNATVGAIEANSERILLAYQAGEAAGADLVVTPELSLIGYPPEDLVLKPFFQRSAMDAAVSLAAATAGQGRPGLLIGTCWVEAGKLYNAAILLENGGVKAIRFKRELPNYGVFDEQRVFEAGTGADPIDFRGVKLGVIICEDMWLEASALELSEAGAEIILVPTCSPFEADKHGERLVHAKNRVADTGLPLLFCNQIGGQDELVFEGASFVLNGDASVAVQMKDWVEDGCLTIWNKSDRVWSCESQATHKVLEGYPAIYQAMMLGLRDYVQKNRFPGVVLGMSGGIDSALSAAIAADALGPEKVHAIMMPSKYTSGESLGDAETCSKALGVRYDVVAIKPGIEAMDGMLDDLFDGRDADTTEENIQARLRGNILMAVSNKFGDMVLTTGNKSEMSVGYATLYGDMCGGYSVLKDLYKMDVFGISHWRNANQPIGGLAPAGEVIPENIITKPPTAELRDDQKDEDSLPPYEQLDDILRCFVDNEMAASDIIARGHEANTVARIEHLLYTAEYKRRQAPPGVKLTRKNFGRDRRYPITNGFRTAKR